ncbi:hypothetical protein PMAYCL1PPCAC_28545, partial [Pristionchus mayeri]
SHRIILILPMQHARARAFQVHPHGGGFGGGPAFIMAVGGNPPPAFLPPNHPPPPAPAPEPDDLPEGGVISLPCNAMKLNSVAGITVGGGGQNDEYDKCVIHQQPEPYSMCAPSEDTLLWVAKGGQELVVVNTRLQLITKHHQLRATPQTVGIALSSRCAMFTTDSGFVVILSPVDKTFRLIHELELRILIHGHPLRPSFGPVRANRSRMVAGKATHVLKDGDTIVHLLAEPPLALYFSISDIKKCVGRRQQTIEPFDVKDLTGLPSQLLGRSDPLESAIMLLEDRIILGGPIITSDHLEWAYFDVKKGVVKRERVFDSPMPSPLNAPALHPQYLLKLRLNPMNLDEIYVHIIHNNATMAQRRVDREAKGELWVMGMSKHLTSFQWKRRERAPASDDPEYKQKMQTPMDWTHTPKGIMYVRWCEFEGLGPGDEYLCDYRLCRSFTLTRSDSTISSLSSMAASVLQGFTRLPFPISDLVDPLLLGLPPGHDPPPLMTLAHRRRAAVTGVATGADFTRHVAAVFLSNTSHVYYQDEMVYDDTEDMIEAQRKAIAHMNQRTPFRSIFGNLYSQATRRDNPAEMDDAPPVGSRSDKISIENGGSGDTTERDDGLDDQPGPSHRNNNNNHHRHGHLPPGARRLEQVNAIHRYDDDFAFGMDDDDALNIARMMERELMAELVEEVRQRQRDANAPFQAPPAVLRVLGLDEEREEREVVEEEEEEEQPGMMAEGDDEDPPELEL